MPILDALQAVSILAPGPLAQLRTDLVEIGSLFEIDETALKSSVVLPGHSTTSSNRRALGQRPPRGLRTPGQRPALIVDRHPRRQPEREGDGRADRLRQRSWPRARSRLSAETRTLPDLINSAFIEALNQVFNRVDIHHVSPHELTVTLFPDTSPATAEQLRERLDGLHRHATSGAPLNGCASFPREDNDS